MAENKNSFILYADLIHTVKKMPREKAGELFMVILSYVNDENPAIDDMVVDLVFEPIKQQLKRDLKKFETKKKKLSNSGIKGMEKRWGKGEEPITTLQDVITDDKVVISPITNITDNVNDNVTVNVNDNDIIINNCVKIPLKDSTFPSMPHAEDLDAAPKTTVKSAIEMLKITCQVDLEEPEVHTMWNIFKDQNLTGKRYYPDKEAVYAHFINWIVKKDFKKQKNGISKTSYSSQKSAGRNALADGLAEKLRL